MVGQFWTPMVGQFWTPIDSAFRHTADRPGAVGTKVGEQPDDVALRDAVALHDLVWNRVQN